MKISIVSRCLTLLFAVAITNTSSAASSEKAIYEFKNGNDGAHPIAGLVSDKAGNLYGTTLEGGHSCNCGTVFELSFLQGKGWTKSTLYEFQGPSDGENPASSLILDSTGNLFGTTSSGGSSNGGTVFQLAPPKQQGGSWTETVLYSFTNYTDGGFPSALIMDSLGNLYGENPGRPLQDNGYVFELTPPATRGGAWIFSDLYDFRGGMKKDGSSPIGGLRQDKAGNLYGTTEFGGSVSDDCGIGGAQGCGTVFMLKRPTRQGGSWTERVLHVFTNFSDGAQPVGGVTFGRNNSSLYGTTTGGGSQFLGTVFQLTPPVEKGNPWTEAVLFSTSNAPNAVVVFDKLGNLYSTSSGGLVRGSGTVFELSPPAQQVGDWTYSSLYEFNEPWGDYSTSGVILNKSENALYGAHAGTPGRPDNGIVYKIGLP
jgi:uncharacterized repeat protein (TIGR03803 family)